MFLKNDNPERQSRARKNWGHKKYIKYLIVAGVALVVIVTAILIGRTMMKTPSGTPKGTVGQEASPVNASLGPEEMEASRQAEGESKAQAEEEAIQAVVDFYENLGTIQVSGYLSVRRTSDPQGNIINELQENSACEIAGSGGEWYHINSGGVDGYTSNRYVVSGDETRAKVLEYVKLRAIVTADNPDIRSAPTMDDPSNVVAQALLNERHKVISQEGGWIQIPSGYISANYTRVKLALNEARKMDLKAMAVNQYGNIAISKVSNYLNVRSPPKDEGNANIIGKLPSNAAGEIIDTGGGWYKIKSGNTTGYMTIGPQCTATGDKTRELAMVPVSLMAIVNTDRLNVREEPSTESSIWTQISEEDRYSVVQQMDGWVQIELDTGEEDSDAAYISARDNNVEVRYALAEAIKSSPLEEKANQQAPLRNKIVNYVLQFAGNRYVRGGTSLTKGADRSGLTQSVMKNFGISLPRVSRGQANAGRAVKSSEMRPGDLIFYTNSGGTIDHVAIYIGNGQVVHVASTRSGIRILTWNYRSPAKVRNVIDQGS